MVHFLGRFAVMANMRKTVDEIRAAEAKELKAKGYEPILRNTHWHLPHLRTTGAETRSQILLRTQQVL